MVTMGYVRVSSKDQNEERQVEKMKSLGVSERYLFVEKQSGKDFNRPVYQALCQMLRPSDLLYIDSIDRLGRNYEAVKAEWRRLTREMGVDVVALDMPDLFDSRKFREQGDVGKLLEDQMLSLLAWVAEQERNKIRTRQREGIAIAKRQGKYKGRKRYAACSDVSCVAKKDAPMGFFLFDKHFKFISKKLWIGFQ